MAWLELFPVSELFPDTVNNVPLGNNVYEGALSAALEGLSVDDIAVSGRGLRRSASVRIAGRPTRLTLRSAGRGWPQDVAEALEDVEAPWPRNLVLVAREFSPGALSLLRERDANWADLVGQARIVVPDRIAVIASRAVTRSLNTNRGCCGGLRPPSPRPRRCSRMRPPCAIRISPRSPAGRCRRFRRRSRPSTGTAGRNDPGRSGAGRRYVSWSTPTACCWNGSRHLVEERRPSRYAHTTSRDAMAIVGDALAPALLRTDWTLSGWRRRRCSLRSRRRSRRFRPT